jgi:hypothetical protein
VSRRKGRKVTMECFFARDYVNRGVLVTGAKFQITRLADVIKAFFLLLALVPANSVDEAWKPGLRRVKAYGHLLRRRLLIHVTFPGRRFFPIGPTFLSVSLTSFVPCLGVVLDVNSDIQTVLSSTFCNFFPFPLSFLGSVSKCSRRFGNWSVKEDTSRNTVQTLSYVQP